ncbi:hypothetical protein [Asticcacaulis sp. AND118]|uniref:hypothetical protein n=1 Tax=Asticcacaulis sp. AND118 TaxID=2840468 RepID=UPI001CFF5848|nr:hypothetical protein [Asticcacaulis sp. AND118]UDF02772.1 hypothetical protein LH365_10045 [Asticcacaulis sp. AND118]
MRAFADRMLLRAEAMDDPEDMVGVERAVRVAAVIERIYSRCDRAEGQAPDPRRLEAERAVNQSEAIKARAQLASTLEWGDKRRQALGPWWDAAQPEVAVQPFVQNPPQTVGKASVKAASPVTGRKPVEVKSAVGAGFAAKAAGLPGLTPAKVNADEVLRTLAGLQETASVALVVPKERHPTTPP